MKRRKSLSYVAVLLFTIAMTLTNVSLLEAQDNRRIMIIPFNPINMPKDEAEILYTDFESALVATRAYVVVDRDEVIKLLGDGEEGLFSCTNAQCAIDIGLRLAAEHVVRGTVYRTSDGYTLKIRVVDVSNGRVIFLDDISNRFFSEMRDSMELLAFEVSGLVTIKNERPEIARQFTEVFIETVPSRADIYINGIKKGISPDIISRVPVGRIKISAKYGNFYGEKVLEIREGTGQVQIECKEVYGGLMIRTEDNLDVYFDDRWLGKVNSGLFNNLSVGIHSLELKSQEMYWRDEIVIRPNRRTLIQADAEEYGRIDYGIPEGASAEIAGPKFREVVKGYGTLPIPAGSYSITVTGKIYDEYDQITLSVVRGASVPLLPELQYTREYQYQLFTEKIEEVERAIQYGYRLTNSDLRKLRELKNSIEQSKHGFFNLIPRVDSLIERVERIVGGTSLPDTGTGDDRAEKEKRLNALLAQKQGLELELSIRELTRKRRAVGGWTSLGVSTAGFGLAGLFYYLGNDAYRDYQTAPSKEKERLVRFWDTATLAALGTGGACLIVSSIFWISRPPVRQIADELDLLDSEIKLLGDEIR